jgi:prepilin-type N-terminal cleavage/methylation domain-containing protein
MKRRQNKTGVTLVEILVVVAIIAILVTMVIGIAARIDTQGKERLTKNTIALLTAALGQFGDYGYRHKDYSVYPTDDERDFYRSLDFPIDCNGLSDTDLKSALKDALGAGSVLITGGTHEPNYSGSEALYFFLSRVPDCRETLDKIDKSLITNKGSNGADMTITIDTKSYPLMRIIDPWDKTLRYDYYDERESDFKKRKDGKNTFPLITSAGPDKEFGSADDITSRD